MRAAEIAEGIALHIDGLWLRRGRSKDDASNLVAIARLEAFVDDQLAKGRRKRAPAASS
jgi:hypothetical protein